MRELIHVKHQPLLIKPDQGFQVGPEYPLYDHKQRIIRNELYVCRTAGVSEKEYNAILSGVKGIMEESHRNIKVIDYGNYRIYASRFNSPEWYQENSMIENGKVNASQVNEFLKEEPFQKENPHFDLIVLDKDLTIRDSSNRGWLNYIFGLASYPNNIISVARFRRIISDDTLIEPCLKIIGAHEFGHNLGLVQRKYNVGSDGIEANHCLGEKGPCIMEQFNIGKKTIEQLAIAIMNEDRDTILCPDCTNEIEYRRNYYRDKNVFW